MNRRIEEQLGRPIDRAVRHSVASLNDVTPQMIEDLRRLDPVYAPTYLDFMLKAGSAAFFEDFVRDVVHGGMEARTWGYRDVIAFVRESGRGGALVMSAEDARAMLGTLSGERWACCAVDRAAEVNARRGDITWAAPGVLVREAPYWWTPPHPQVAFVVLSEAPAKVHPDRFVVAFRRWIALRASWWAMHAHVDPSTAEPRQLAEAIGVAWDNVSRDGAIALSALVREARTPLDPLTQVPGFVGPDDWFGGGETG